MDETSIAPKVILFVVLLVGIAAPCAAQNGILISDTVEDLTPEKDPKGGKLGGTSGSGNTYYNPEPPSFPPK